jgi:peptidyl-Lys metalloendopeptidase
MAWNRWALGAALSVAVLSSQAAPVDNLEVRLNTDKAMLKGDQDAVVTLSITNRGSTPISILKWALPSDKSEGMLFRVTRDGEEVEYLGAIYKRKPPTAADYVKIAPGETLKREVELTANYDMTSGGHYSVEFNSYSQHLFAVSASGAARSFDTEGLGAGMQRGEGSLQSAPAHLWIEHSMASEARRQAKASVTPMVAGGGGISYTGSCSASRQSTLVSAVTAATNYATAANNYLAGTPSATQRFTKWFGTYSSANWSQVKGHYANEVTAFNTKPLVLDCSCTDTGTYAYVYPTQPYKIYVCGAFWSAPMTGTDSKGGTLVHEMSHFNVIAGTQDYAYGQTAAASLAKSNPTKARMNADSHEYFAENTPSLP